MVAACVVAVVVSSVVSWDVVVIIVDGCVVVIVSVILATGVVVSGLVLVCRVVSVVTGVVVVVVGAVVTTIVVVLDDAMNECCGHNIEQESITVEFQPPACQLYVLRIEQGGEASSGSRALYGEISPCMVRFNAPWVMVTWDPTVDKMTGRQTRPKTLPSPNFMRGAKEK